MQNTKFRKKPVVIEAFQLTEERYNKLLTRAFSSTDMPSWLFSAHFRAPEILGSFYNSEDGSLKIHTLEGHMRASPGDWIIRGIHGELYPCKPDIFEATYEPVPRA